VNGKCRIRRCKRRWYWFWRRRCSWYLNAIADDDSEDIDMEDEYEEYDNDYINEDDESDLA
jgi:hypothetical protein